MDTLGLDYEEDDGTYSNRQDPSRVTCHTNRLAMRATEQSLDSRNKRTVNLLIRNNRSTMRDTTRYAVFLRLPWRVLNRHS